MRRGLGGCLVLLLLGMAGCRTAVWYEPEPPDVGDVSFRLPGRLDYAGHPDFLPRTLAPGKGAETSLRLHYRYGTTYRHTTIQLFNPLLILGMRILGVDVRGSGRLAIAEEDRGLETYQAECVVKMRRSVWIWGYPSESELRRRALIAVRQMIEAEMLGDRARLEALSAEASSRASSAGQP